MKKEIMTMPRRSAIALSAFLLLNSIAGAQQASPANYQPTKAPVDLGTLGGSFSQGKAVNAKGMVAGASTLAGDVARHAFLTNKRRHTLIDLGTLPGGTNSTAAAVNVHGVVVGTSDYDDPNDGFVQHAFIYSRGVISDLGTLGGGISEADGIDAEGIVVGSSLLSDQATTHAFWFDPSRKQLNDLGTLTGGTNSAAFGVNLFGQIAGSSETGRVDDAGNVITDAVVWNLLTKKTTDLGTLGGGFGQANAINNYGSAVGFSYTAQGATHGFLAYSGRLLDLGTLGGSYSQATAINDLGVVVGFSNVAGDTKVHAFIWTPRNGLVDLNALLPANSGWELSAAYGINIKGKIVGTGIFNGASHAFAFDLFNNKEKEEEEEEED